MLRMKPGGYQLTGLGVVLWAVAIASAATVAPMADDFTGPAHSVPDSARWMSAVRPNATVTVTQDGSSHLVMDVTAQPGNSCGAAICSVRSDFDFFRQPLTVQWKLDALTGSTRTPGNPDRVTSDSNRAFLLMVDGPQDKATVRDIVPGRVKTSFGLVVDRITDDQGAVSYVLRVEQTVHAQVGNNVLFLASKKLRGGVLPSLISVTFDHAPNGTQPDKAVLRVTLSGATFTDGTPTLAAVSRELNARFNPGVLTASAYRQFHLATGASNNGNARIGTTVKIDKINVQEAGLSTGEDSGPGGSGR